MRALVTGASGFVGRHLVERLRAGGWDVVGACGPQDANAQMLPLDLRDMQSVHAAFDLAQPDIVFHLAAQAFVPAAIQAPQETYETNVFGTARVLQALRAARADRRMRLLFVSSAEVYGAQPASALPLSESCAPAPANPYAASKAAAEALVLGEVHAFGVDAVITRAFNHIGPGQNDRFAVPSFAAQLAAIARGAPPLLHAGNLAARRDFLDVRDVVEAYALLAERGRSGEIYNVCSGSAVSMRDVLGELIRIAHVAVEVRDDPERMRPSDVPLIYGDNRKLREQAGWRQTIPLHRSLQDVFARAQMSPA